MGIFTERDVLRRVVAAQRNPSRTLLRDVMTTPVACASPHTTLEELRQDMRAVMQAYDGRGSKTLLSKLVLKRYGLHTPLELVRSIYGAELPISTVASLTDLVEQAAESGDSVAIAILEESSRELARAIAAIYPKLGSSAIPLILTGGTILHGRYLLKAFNRTCEMQGLVFTTVHYVVEPAESALKLAWQLSLG